METHEKNLPKSQLTALRTEDEPRGFPNTALPEHGDASPPPRELSGKHRFKFCEGRIILASQSPRRRQLLAEAGVAFDAIPPDKHIETPPQDDETPEMFVARLARLKAENVAEKVERGCIIGCDTVAVCRGEILGKPVDRADAEKMLQMLRGTEHRVVSGLCVLAKNGANRRCEVRCETTQLFMLPISNRQIEEYLDSGDWRGKAGAFGYQDGHAWITLVEGSESNVVGLPLELLEGMLSR